MSKVGNRNKGMLILPVLLILAVVLSLAVGYYVFFIQQIENLPMPRQETRVLTAEEVNKVTAQGASDELPVIEKDLNATSFTSIDSDLSNIESELNAALQK